jgi:cytochrome c oxidase subunit IV
MSSNAHAHDAHGHGQGGADHVPHVLPLGVYFKTYGALLFLTAITVGASYFNLGHSGNLVIALAIATMKASIVAMIFMHLYWDQKFFAIIFASSILFLGIFLAFTMFDTTERGVADPIEGDHPADYKVPFAAGGTRSEQNMRREAEEMLKSLPATPAGAVAPGSPQPAPGAPAGAAPTAPGPTDAAGAAGVRGAAAPSGGPQGAAPAPAPAGTPNPGAAASPPPPAAGPAGQPAPAPAAPAAPPAPAK